MSVFLWSNNFWGYFSSLIPHLEWNNLTSVPTQCNQYNLVNILQSSGLKVSMIFVCYLGKYNFPRTSGRTNIFTRILFLCFFKYKMKINSFLSLGVISHIHFGKVTISHLNSTGTARWPVVLVFTLIVVELYLKNEVFGVSV